MDQRESMHLVGLVQVRVCKQIMERNGRRHSAQLRRGRARVGVGVEAGSERGLCEKQTHSAQTHSAEAEAAAAAADVNGIALYDYDYDSRHRTRHIEQNVLTIRALLYSYSYSYYALYVRKSQYSYSRSSALFELCTLQSDSIYQ